MVTENQNIEAPGSQVDKLRGADVMVEVQSLSGLMHHKFAILDRKTCPKVYGTLQVHSPNTQTMQWSKFIV